MDNKNIAQDIMKAHYELTRQQEPLEEIAKRIAETYRKEHLLKQKPSTAKKIELSEERENELCKIVTQASHDNPELDEEFLTAIPDLHLSWQAIKLVNKSSHLRKVYATVMLAIYQKQLPEDVIVRILSLDNVDEFVKTLNNCGYEWSRKAQTIMCTLHNKLYLQMFEQPKDYDTYMV